MPETTAEFLHRRNDTRHAKCNSPADMIGGDIEMHFCPECLELDMQAVLALQAALTAFKATGYRMQYAPDFREVDASWRIHQSSVKLPDHVRAWRFYLEFDVDGEGDDSEYYAYIILKADGTYQAFRAD